MIWSLQILRFVAALMVVYVHAAQTAVEATGSNGLLPHDFQVVGRAGVDIFFVISGVIIARTAPGLTWKSFAWRRFRRIVPPYLLVSIPYAIVSYEAGFGWRDAMATLLLWPATDQMTPPALPAAWTLCFEMLFYAAATIVLADRRLILVVLGTFGLAIIFRSSGPVFQFLGNPLIIEFGFGVALAYAPRWKSAVWCLPVGAVAMIAAGFIGIAPQGGTMEFLTGDNGFQRVLVYGFPALIIVFGTMQIDAKPGAWTVLGDASYMLYLIHTLPITLLLVLWTAFPIPPDLIIVIGVGTSVLFGWRMYIRFELPLRKFLSQAVPVGMVVGEKLSRPTGVIDKR
ncbi:MAG: acyltransferase [Mesorhizobium sp.]|nr:MAG: acyltransferase [Mesorhizobium sp.]